MKRCVQIVLFRLLLLIPELMLAQVRTFYSSAVFSTPDNGNYLETNITVAGNSLSPEVSGDTLRNSVKVRYRIYQDTTIINEGEYNVLGPAYPAGIVAPAFIDNHRYALVNGNYNLWIEIYDLNDSLKRPSRISDRVRISFSEKEIGCSSIQALESFKKAGKTGVLTKSGYDLVPYNVNYYPEATGELNFYVEFYNADLLLGEGSPLVLIWYLETASSNPVTLGGYGAFQKQKAQRVNPLLAKMDISKLGSGNYNLVVELKNQENRVLEKKKYYFERRNRNTDLVELQKFNELQEVAEYFGNCYNADTIKMYVECLWPIANGLDKERIINQAVKRDVPMMKRFVMDFWERRAADTANPLDLWARYYQQVQVVMALFKCGKQNGYYTDRGRVYLQYGPPNQRAQQVNEPNTFPYEIWHYYSITDGASGSNYTNRRFVFVNKMIGDDCHSLVHSDMRGETNNPRWQFEVTRRNNNGIGNPDNTVPVGTEHNQFNDMYVIPR